VTVVINESSIEIGESQKPLKILHSRGQGPVPYSFHLPLVHLHSLLVYDVAQKLQVVV